MRLALILLQLLCALAHADDVPIDRIWAGTRVNFDAVAVDDRVYAAYYDAERWLKVARIDLQTKAVQTLRLQSQYGGWDGHNYVTIAYDAYGFLHVAGNMHTSPLVYARMQRKGDFDSLALVNRMTGIEEKSVTYPQFFLIKDGSLGFTYRAGRSGNGAEYINRFDGEKWVRLLDRPLFAHEEDGDVSAYHSGYVRAPDGRYYVAWVWRKKPSDAANNFDVCFAQSDDLKTWRTSRGQTLTLPITPANAEVVDRIPTGGGLFNNVRLGFDPSGRPVISYLKYDAAGNTQLYHARLEGGRWNVVQATTWDYRWELKGGGTLVGEIVIGGVSVVDGRMQETVRHSKFGTQLYEYSPDTLRVADVRRPPRAVDEGAAKPPPPFVTVRRPVKKPSGEPVPQLFIEWVTLPADNRDKARSCESARLPPDCKFEAQLRLVRR